MFHCQRSATFNFKGAILALFPAKNSYVEQQNLESFPILLKKTHLQFLCIETVKYSIRGRPLFTIFSETQFFYIDMNWIFLIDLKNNHTVCQVA